VFCNDDGLAAIITAIWAARDAQAECRSLGFGGSYAVVNRRFSSGKCAPSASRKTHFEKRARAAGIAPGEPARLGKKWAKKSTERDAIYAHMLRRAASKGYLSSQAVADGHNQQ
jgi:hypothetical protein